MHIYPVYVYPVQVYAMNAINTVRTHAQTHAHSYAYVQSGKGVFDHTKEIEDEEKRAVVPLPVRRNHRARTQTPQTSSCG